MKDNESLIINTAQLEVKERKTLYFYAIKTYPDHIYREIPYTEDETVKEGIVKDFIEETKKKVTRGFSGYMYASFYVIRDVWVTFEGKSCHVVKHQKIYDKVYYVFDKENRKQKDRPIVFRWKKAIKVLDISRFTTLQKQQKDNKGKERYIVDVTNYEGVLGEIGENIRKTPNEYGITTSERRGWFGGIKKGRIQKVVYSSCL